MKGQRNAYCLNIYMSGLCITLYTNKCMLPYYPLNQITVSASDKI